MMRSWGSFLDISKTAPRTYERDTKGFFLTALPKIVGKEFVGVIVTET